MLRVCSVARPRFELGPLVYESIIDLVCMLVNPANTLELSIILLYILEFLVIYSRNKKSKYSA